MAKRRLPQRYATPSPGAPGCLTRSIIAAAVAGVALALGTPQIAAAAPVLPEIRTSEANKVPACVTPERLMAYVRSRNQDLAPRFAEIANWYRYWGEAWRIRWDYAFFQMLLETNFLSYRRGDGSFGDVMPDQNNFAGLGATGGGVAGDRFPDVKTGVLAQIQHLVAYSGERLAAPTATRTRDKQEVIVRASRSLGRPVRFSDLTRRWAADPKYHRSIESVAARFFQQHCSGGR